jgi:hypothetical protein
MKVGMVKMSVVEANGLNLSAAYYLDRCSNCGHQQDDPKFHQNGRCGQYKRVFVESGTSFEDATKELK